jgi:hypothetical protein
MEQPILIDPHHRAGSRSRAGELLAASIIALVATLSIWLTTERLTRDHELFARPWDHHKYIEIASSDLGSFHIAPYCWRIGAPLLAATLPGGIQTGFITISLIGSVLVGVLLYLIARQLGFSNTLALAGLLLFYSLEWGPKLFLFDFWLPDAPAAAMLTAAIWGIVTRRDWLLIVVLVAGVSVKESVIFVVPLVYTLRAARWWDRGPALRAALLVLPALVSLVVIRLAIPAWNDDPAYVASLPERLWLVQLGSADYGYAQSLREIGIPRLTRPTLDALASYTLRPFTVGVTVLACVGALRGRVLLVRLLPFLTLVYLQILFAGDVERLLVLAFPAVLLLALVGLRSVITWSGAPEWTALGLPVMMLAVELWRDDWFFLPLRLQAALAVASLLAPAAIYVSRRPGAPRHARPAG